MRGCWYLGHCWETRYKTVYFIEWYIHYFYSKEITEALFGLCILGYVWTGIFFFYIIFRKIYESKKGIYQRKKFLDHINLVQKRSMYALVTGPFLIITILLTYEDLADFGNLALFNQFQLVWHGFGAIGSSIGTIIIKIGSNLLFRDELFIEE